MPIDLGQNVQAGASGLAGAIIGAVGSFFGLKQRIDKVESEFAEHKKGVVYEDTCKKCEARKDDQVKALQTSQKESREELRSLREEVKGLREDLGNKLDKVYEMLLKQR